MQKKQYSIEEASIAIVEYYATLVEADKIRIYKEFKKPNLKIRILAATDAIALGCDIPDIKRAI